MLILTRRPGERVVIGEDVFVTVMAVSGHTVRLGITAPSGVPIYREELWLAVRDENRAAAAADPAALPPEPPAALPQRPSGAPAGHTARAEEPLAGSPAAGTAQGEQRRPQDGGG